MKKNVLLLILSLGLGISSHVRAQENVPKEVVLTTLNSFNKLRLSNLKTSELMKYNEGYVEKVYKILESDQLEKDQKDDLKILADARERDLINLLGSSKTRKYAHLTDREMRLPVHKNKLLKYIY